MNWEKEHIADQLRHGVSVTDVMNGVRARRAEDAAAVATANALVRPDMPWNHDFTPDPQTPTACLIDALDPAWHRDHQPEYDES